MKPNTIAFQVMLATGTTAFAIMVLQTALDIRGANHFVRLFHYGGAVIAAVLTTLLVEFARRRLPRLKLFRPWCGASVFLIAFCILWSLILPCDDAVAQLVERMIRTPQQIGDTGYGWFYYDDSGMGATPMHFAIVFLYNLLTKPWWFAGLVIFIFTVHVLGLRQRPIDENVT